MYPGHVPSQLLQKINLSWLKPGQSLVLITAINAVPAREIMFELKLRFLFVVEKSNLHTKGEGHCGVLLL